MTFNISFVIKSVQKYFAVNQVTAGTLVLTTYANRDDVYVDVSSKMITNLVKRDTEVHGAIKAVAVKEDAIEELCKYVDLELVKKYSKFIVDEFCSFLIENLRKEQISYANLRQLEELYNNEDYAKVIARVFSLAMIKDNVLETGERTYEDVCFLEEVANRCPLCNAQLIVEKRGKLIQRYEIVEIPEINFDIDLLNAKKNRNRMDSLVNKIALCRDCSENYGEDARNEDFVNLRKCKDKILSMRESRLILETTTLEQEIKFVVQRLSDLNVSTLIKPFTDVLRLEQKINPENHLLVLFIKDNVIRFYPYVEMLFSELDDKKVNTFNVIRSEITSVYEKLEQQGLDQGAIFNYISSWIVEANGLEIKYKTASDIVVAFFVQNCSIFKLRADLNIRHKDRGTIYENAK